MLYGTVFMKQFNTRISEDCNTEGLINSICKKSDMSYTKSNCQKPEMDWIWIWPYVTAFLGPD